MNQHPVLVIHPYIAIVDPGSAPIPKFDAGQSVSGKDTAFKQTRPITMYIQPAAVAFEQGAVPDQGIRRAGYFDAGAAVESHPTVYDLSPGPVGDQDTRFL